MKLVNPFECEGQWYKANLHCHSTVSDGEAEPQERIKQYREQGYQVLALTDHRKTSDVTGWSSDDLLVIGGLEAHPQCPYGASIYHLVCLNVPHGFEVPDDEDPNEQIMRVKQAGGEVILAHPYWSGHNITHAMAIANYIAVEAYNSTCGRIGKAYSSVAWDDILAQNRVIGAVAVDDTHHGRDIFMGWTMIKARELSVEAIMESLRHGCYYASCGPVIESFGIVEGRAKITCSPVREIHLMSPGPSGLSFYADPGEELLTTADRGLPEGLPLVRAEIVDTEGRRAWSNPIILGSKDANSSE